MCDYLLHYFSGNRGWNDWQLLALPTPPFWIVYAMFLLFRSPEISVFFLSSWWWLLILLTLVWNPSGPANQVKKYSLSEQSLRFFPQSGFAVSNVNTKGIESFSFPCVPLWLPPPRADRVPSSLPLRSPVPCSPPARLSGQPASLRGLCTAPAALDLALHCVGKVLPRDALAASSLPRRGGDRRAGQAAAGGTSLSPRRIAGSDPPRAAL